MLKIFLLFLILFQFALAESEKPLIKSTDSPRIVTQEKEFLIEGYTLVPGGTVISSIDREEGVHIFLKKDRDYRLLREKLEALINHPLSDKLIKQVKQTVIDFFQDQYGEYVAVILPIQKVTNGVMVLQVLRGRVKSVDYKGQKWFSKKVMKNAINIKPGAPLIQSDFVNAVTWSNRNPFRKTELVLVPGKDQGETSLVFVTKDQFPVRFFAGGDNTGFKSNNVYRIYAGANWGNAFFIGDILSYQYTAAPNFHDFQSHTGSYTSFLPWRHVLSFFGTYGTVFPNIPNFRVDGENIQASMRYQILFLPLYGLFRHNFQWGWDWKYITSNLFFVGTVAQEPDSISQITVTDLMASYRLEKNSPGNLFKFRLDMFLSPWKNWFPYQSTSAYAGLRAGSNVRYAYWRGEISNLYVNKRGISFNTQIRGQLATGTLPASEQFGLGGVNTVRGYDEQQFVADDAVCVNLEVFTPKFSVVKKWKDQCSFLLFNDYGFGYNYTSVSNRFVDQNLWGLGLGMRYQKTHFTAKLDYGFQLVPIPQNSRFGRFHFRLNASY